MRPLSKLAVVREVQGDTKRRTGVYTTPVHEDSSTVSTKQFPATVEFGKGLLFFNQTTT
nr:palindromic element RPE1 domain-containing protein [Legionella anisa]